jgi:outer membrane lipoprotein-sorting protein
MIKKVIIFPKLDRPDHMKIPSPFLHWLFAAILLVGAAWSQQPPDAQSDAALDKVLAQMDTTAANFRTTEASFVWDQYEKVVNETDTQKGKIYFRRAGKETQMAADITEPDKKYVLFTNGKIEVYQSRIDQVTIYNAGKNREAFESFLVLGFGGGGHDMLKSFDVKFLGTENVDGTDAAKLNLVPKSPKIRNNFDHIVLWIDPARGVSIQQQLFEPSGDYRLARYSDIKLNQKIPDSVFKLKTTSRTKTVSPQ